MIRKLPLMHWFILSLSFVAVFLAMEEANSLFGSSLTTSKSMESWRSLGRTLTISPEKTSNTPIIWVQQSGILTRPHSSHTLSLHWHPNCRPTANSRGHSQPEPKRYGCLWHCRKDAPGKVSTYQIKHIQRWAGWIAGGTRQRPSVFYAVCKPARVRLGLLNLQWSSIDRWVIAQFYRWSTHPRAVSIVLSYHWSNHPSEHAKSYSLSSASSRKPRWALPPKVARSRLRGSRRVWNRPLRLWLFDQAANRSLQVDISSRRKASKARRTLSREEVAL